MDEKVIKKRLEDYLLTLPSPHTEAMVELLKLNFEVYLVGGTVRDIIMGRTPNDIDLATNALPEEVLGTYSMAGNYTVIPTGLKHGTVTVRHKRATEPIEITTFRKDVSCDGRNATVEYSKTIEEDLSRRDFTMNAIALNLGAYFFGEARIELVDPYYGIGDIEDKVIRVVGDATKRFEEDNLRLVRMCRFAATLGFDPYEEDIIKATKFVKAKSREISYNVSIERFRDELMKAMKADKPSVAIEHMRVWGLLDIFIPELLEGVGMKQNDFHQYTVYKHLIEACDACDSEDPLMTLTALFHNIGKPRTKGIRPDGKGHSFHSHETEGAMMTRRIMRRLKFSNKENERVSNLIANHMFNDQGMKMPSIRRLVRKVGVENMEDLFTLRKADREGSGKGAWGFKNGEGKTVQRVREKIHTMIEEDQAFKITDLKINGNDLIKEFNIKPGPIFKEILNHCLELVLDDPGLNNKDSLFRIVDQLIYISKSD